MRLLVALLLLAATPAAAQLPVPTCGALAMNLVPQEAEADAGSSRDLAGVLQNRGQTEGVARLEAAEIPEGWTATIEPTNVTLPAGASGDFTVTVGVPAGATVRGTVTVGAFLDCGFNVLRSQPVRASAEVTPIPPPEDGFVPTLGTLAREYGAFALALAALVALGGGVLLGARRGRTSLAVDCPEPEKLLRPGRGISFPVRIANRGKDSDTVHFEVGAVPAGWAAFTAVPEVALGPGESRTLWLMVRAPPGASDGARAAIDLVVRSDAAPTRSATTRVEAEVRESAEPDMGAGVSP